MGKQTSAIRFTGKLGGLIGYTHNGVDCVRTCPVSVKQTSGTRRAAREFGKASNAAALIRHALQDVAHVRYDRGFQNRLNKAMGKVLRSDIPQRGRKRRITTANLRQLVGFRVNDHSPIQHHTLTQRVYDGSILVTVPRPISNFPDKTPHMQFRAIAICPDFELGGAKTVVSETITVSRAEAGKAITLSIPVKGKHDAVIFLEALSYTNRRTSFSQDMHRYRNAITVIAVIPGIKKGKPNTGFATEPVEHFAPLPDNTITTGNRSPEG